MADQQHHTYLHGKPVEGVIESHEHISPVANYVKVLLALFFLTALTYGVSFADLGSASLPVAMIVAVVKATLVCMFFMHLKYDDRYHVFVFMSTIIFVAIFFTFTLFDLMSRPRLNDEQGTFFRVDHEGNWDDAQRKRMTGPPEGGEQGGEGKAPDAKAPAEGKAAEGKTPAPAPDAKEH